MASESRHKQSTSSMDYCSDIQTISTTSMQTKSGGGIATMMYLLIIGK